jgi:hypothetical protein
MESGGPPTEIRGTLPRGVKYSRFGKCSGPFDLPQWGGSFLTQGPEAHK